MLFLKYTKTFIYSPILLLCVLAYLFSKRKEIIAADMQRLGYRKLKGIVSLLVSNKEFRNIFYYRIGLPGRFLNIFLRENPTLHIMTKNIGEGLLIIHGDSTFLNAKKIGNNLYVNQCVTIGVIGKNAPVIGDNVRVATGAIVLGDIVVGNNVQIGAGAVVVKNVPDNCTVIGNPARIIKLNGVKVDIKL